MQLQSPIENVYFTNNSSINSTEDNLIEVYSTSDLISKKQLRGNCFLQYNGFFYNLKLIKWPGTNRYIYFNNRSSVNSFKTKENTTIDFDLCNDIVDPNCPEDFSNVLDRKNCVSFSGTSKKDKYWKFIRGIQ